MPPKKKPKRDASNWTVPRQFRLEEETLAELDKIAAHLKKESGVTHSRANAIRYAARQTVRMLGLDSHPDA